MKALLPTLACFIGLGVALNLAARAEGLDEAQRKSIAELAGTPGDFDLIHLVWRFGRVPPPKGEELAAMQSQVFAFPGWEERLWNRLSALAREAEAEVELNRRDPRLQGSMKALPKFNLLLSRVAWIRSEKVAPLILPFLDSPSIGFGGGDVVYSGLRDCAVSGVVVLTLGNVPLNPPAPRPGSEQEWRDWWAAYKRANKMKHAYHSVLGEGGAAGTGLPSSASPRSIRQE